MDAETRRLERSGAAVLRALGRSPRAEYRARQLEVDDRPIAIAAPYLVDEFDDETPGRGVYDALGVRLRDRKSVV